MSALRTVESLCAMTIDVLPFVKYVIACWILFSVSASKDDVASSNKIIGLFLSIALAIDNRCFSPPESLRPFSPFFVGVFKLNYQRFLLFDLIACAVWASGLILLVVLWDYIANLV